MKKRYIFLGLIVIIAAAAYYFTPSLNSIVRKLVNKYGSEVTGTEVNLKGFDFSITKGTASIDEITVANPKNYKTPYIFDLNKISVKVNLKSLTSNTIIIDSVEVNKPEITYEMLSLTQNNIKEIQNNIQKYLQKSASDKKADEPKKSETPKESGESKNVIIKKLVISDGKLTAASMGQEVAITLPTIEMSNIGQKSSSKGTDIPTVIASIITKILNVASQTVVQNNLSDLENVAKENLNNVVGNVKDRVKTLGIFSK